MPRTRHSRAGWTGSRTSSTFPTSRPSPRWSEWARPTLPPRGWAQGLPPASGESQLALGTSHDEQDRQVVGETPIRGSGTGRYLNFGALGRYRVGLADSLEVGLERREHQITDFSEAAFVPPPPVFLYQRDLTARRLDAAAGWRHRWKGLEAAASVRYIAPFGRSENDETLYQSYGSLWGGAVEARWCRGGWTLAFAAERAAGTLDVARAQHARRASIGLFKGTPSSPRFVPA